MEDWARETERMISAEGGQSIVLGGDVSRDAECARIVEAAIAGFGDVSVLVNNVGVAGPAGTAVEVDPDEWDTAMQVNVKSMMLMSRHVIPSLRRTGGGSIVNMSSAAGLVGGHPALMYATSKGAITNMTRSMAVHHGPDGIRVNCIAPGMVYTPMVTSRGMSSELREARRVRSLLQTEGTAWDVAGAVVFLASQLARWVTGVVLPVDAGYSAAGTPLVTPPRE